MQARFEEKYGIETLVAFPLRGVIECKETQEANDQVKEKRCIPLAGSY